MSAQLLAEERLLQRAAGLLGAEAMHYRKPETKAAARRYQALLETMNELYALLGQPENIMPLPAPPNERAG